MNKFDEMENIGRGLYRKLNTNYTILDAENKFDNYDLFKIIIDGQKLYVKRVEIKVRNKNVLQYDSLWIMTSSYNRLIQKKLDVNEINYINKHFPNKEINLVGGEYVSFVDLCFGKYCIYVFDVLTNEYQNKKYVSRYCRYSTANDNGTKIIKEGYDLPKQNANYYERCVDNN